MTQSEFDLAEWLVYEKEILMADIGPKIRQFISNYPDRTNPFKETAYINDLRNTVKKNILQRTITLKGNEWTIEELHAMFDEDRVKLVIDRHYIREYLYD